MGSRLSFSLTAIVLVPSLAVAATLLPLQTEDAVLLPPGRLELAVGAEARSGMRALFSDAERDEWSAPELAVNAGLGSRAEAQLRWEALHLDEEPTTGAESRNSYGTGDARLFTKIRVFSAGDYELGWLPATALHFGVKLPNASRPSGRGTDEADFFGRVLLSQDVAGFGLHANLGIGVLGNPGEAGGQDDVLLYEIAAASPVLTRLGAGAFSLLAEVTGAAGSRYDNDRSHIRVGARLAGERIVGYVGGSTGLEERSEDFGIRFGIVIPLRVFTED